MLLFAKNVALVFTLFVSLMLINVLWHSKANEKIVSDLDCDDDCSQPDGAVGGGSIGLGSSIADSEDLFSVAMSNMNLVRLAKNLFPILKKKAG